jgi:hypothetical protein
MQSEEWVLDCFLSEQEALAMELQHGCRSEYGPLEFRIQTSASSNGFMVYVEDPRLEHACVYE